RAGRRGRGGGEAPVRRTARRHRRRTGPHPGREGRPPDLLHPPRPEARSRHDPEEACMNSVILAAEGGYQDFVLKGGEWAILALAGISALLALAVGFVLMRDVLAQDQGTPKMIEIAKAIQEGA